MSRWNKATMNEPGIDTNDAKTYAIQKRGRNDPKHANSV